MPTSLHKVDTAPNMHWHENKGSEEGSSFLLSALPDPV